MSKISENATVSLFVNGEQAEAAMDRLRKKAADLDKQLKSAMDAGDKKTANRLQRELDRVNKELNRTESAAKGTGIALNNLSNTSIHGLRNSLKYLQKQLSMTKPDSERWKDYAEKIELVKDRLSELNEELEGGKSLWGHFKSWADDTWPAIDLLSRGYETAVDTLRGYVDAYAEMDQEMANVRKFTGMTEVQVADLNEEFKKMDTRTSREDLNKLAQEAGRLGKTSIEDVLGFVRAADQINVALDDLGDGATLTLSKLTGIFGDEAVYGTEQSLLKVGSVINELSQNCSASAPYLAQFAERMGGVGAQAGMTIPQIMGFAAVLDSNSQAVEASSTALSQVLVRMMQEPAKYAKVAGLDVTEFATKLKEDANGALIMFLETLQKAGGMDVLSPMFKDMGENGSRAIAALSTLATHIDAVKAQQEAANVAFAEGTSIGIEYDVQNNTVQAGLDKCKKAANELRVELGEHLNPLMGHMLSTSSAVIRGLLTVINFIGQHKAGIIAITAATLACIVVLNKELIVKKLVSAVDTVYYYYLVLEAKAKKTLAVVTEGLSLVYYKCTGQVSKAIVAQKSFNSAMAATPWGAILAAITAAVVAFKAFGNQVEETKEQYKALDEAKENAAVKYNEEKYLLDQNIKKCKEFAGSKSEEQTLIAQLNEKYGPILGTYDSLAGWLQTLTTRGNEYCMSLQQQIIMEGKLEQARQLVAKAAKFRNEGDGGDFPGKYEEYAEVFWRNFKEVPEFIRGNGFWHSYDEVHKENVKAYAKRSQEKADELEAQALKLREEAAKEAEDVKNTFPTISPSVTPTVQPSHSLSGSAAANSDRFEAEKSWREEQEALARIAYATGETTYSEHNLRMAEIAEEYQQKLLERDDLTEAERLKIEVDYWEALSKEAEAGSKDALDVENRRYQRLLDSLKKNHIDRLKDESLSAEDRKREDESYKEALELAELQHLEKIRDIYAERSAERLDAQRKLQEKELAAQERHLEAMAKLEQKYASMKDKYFGDNEQEREQKYNDDLAALKVVYDREIEAAGENASEKERIEKQYQEAQRALRLLYGKQSEEDTKVSLQNAVSKSVEWLNSDGGKAVTGTLSTLASGMSSIFSGLSSTIQAELQLQTAAIEARYNKEIEYAQGNSYKVAKLEKKKEAEIAKAKNDANRKMFAMQVIQAVAQTAQNAINAYGSAAAIPVVGHVMAPIAAAMAVAAGMIQIASIKKQQQAAEAQGYSKGGFTPPGAVDEPAGIVHAGEWVASQRLLASPVARPMIEALDYAQRTNTIGSLRAEDVSRSIRANDSLVRMAEGDSSAALVVAAVARNAEVVDALTRRLNEPFVTVNSVTGDHGIKQAQDNYARLIKNVTPKSKQK